MKEGLDTLLKNIRETGSTDQRHESGRPRRVRTEENVSAVHKLVVLLNTNTSLNTPDIETDGSNTV